LMAALHPAEHPDRKSIRRGVEWLISRQAADGSWPEPDTTGTGFPRVFYLKYDMYRNNWPLLALADFHRVLAMVGKNSGASQFGRSKGIDVLSPGSAGATS
jgi:squalene-hopene/tetraprenyl-beta-curcumene cyclase